MTNEELQAHIRALDGVFRCQQVQFNNDDGEWEIEQTPFAAPENYRIKPKPREVFIDAASFEIMTPCDLVDGCHVHKAHSTSVRYGDGRVLRFREVIEGDSE